MAELTIHYSRCNFCFKWFDFASKFRCELAVCNDCFGRTEGKQQLRVAASRDRYVYRVLFVQTPQRCDEEELLLTENDEYKKSAYEDLDEAFAQQSKQLVSRYRKCKRRLDYLEPDATFEQLKAAVNSFKKEQPEQSVLDICMDSRVSETLNGLLRLTTAAREDTQQEFESRLSSKSVEKGISATFQKPKHSEILNTTSRLFEPRQSLCLTSFDKISSRPAPATTGRSIRDARLSEPSYALKSKIGTLFQKEEKGPANRMMIDKIYAATQSTLNKAGSIELVGHKLGDIDFSSYLSVLDWKDVQTIKLVKVQLNDEHFKTLMTFVKRNPQVQTLVLTNNQLSHLTLETLQDAAENIQLKNIYLGNNTLYTPRAKQLIRQLRTKLNVYV